MNKVITISLGGQERTLLYGTMGYFAYIKEATGQDPYEWLSSFDKLRDKSASDQITVMTEDVAVLIYAGLNSQLDSMDEVNIPIEKVKKWCNALSPEVVGSVMAFAFGAFQVDAPGEVLTPTPAQSNGSGKVSV